MSIQSITPSQILDSKGEPTLKVTIVAEDGTSAWFVVPSGASVGSRETHKKTDNATAYNGKSVNVCLDIISKTIAPKFIGYPIGHQEDFDGLLIALDGSDNKQNLGGNTILALSGAYYKLSAALSKKPLYQYIAEGHGTSPKFPRIYANLVGGGKHAPGLDIQEFMIVPKSDNPVEAIEQVTQIYSALRNIMANLYGPGAKLVGDEGALAPIGARTEVVLEAFASLNSKLENKFDIVLDVAATSFYDGKSYNFEGQSLRASDLLAIYEQWDAKFDLYSIEDPFAENDLEGLELLKTLPKDKKPFLVVADDYTATNAKQITDFAKDKIFDQIVIKPDQIGSITEMFSAIVAAKLAGNEIIISHRSGESNDDFIVDLAYGLGAFGIKIGAPNRGERVAKYNRLLDIQYSLNSLQKSFEPDRDSTPESTQKLEYTNDTKANTKPSTEAISAPSDPSSTPYKPNYADRKNPLITPELSPREAPVMPNAISNTPAPAPAPAPVPEPVPTPSPEPIAPSVTAAANPASVDQALSPIPSNTQSVYDNPPATTMPKIGHATTASNQESDHPKVLNVDGPRAALSLKPSLYNDKSAANSSNLDSL